MELTGRNGKEPHELWRNVAFGTLYAVPSRNGVYKAPEHHGHGYRIVNMGEMFGHEFIADQDMQLVELTSAEMAVSSLEDGDLLFGRRSVVEAGAGKCALVDAPSSPLTFESSIIRVRLRRDLVLPRFLYYFFNSPEGRRRIRNIVAGTNVKGIRGSELRDVAVAAPPLPEQRAIAAALSDVDALIGALDRLIAKKRDLKQATMQQLLTGLTRLPGFGGEWETARLRDFLTVRHGKSQHEVAAVDGAFPILATGGQIGKATRWLYDRPSVLIGRKGTIDHPQYIDVPFWTIDTLFFTEIGPRALPKFVFYKFLMIDWRSYNEASGVPSLNARTIESIQVRIPPLEEQCAIAAVLTDMDAELTALESRRDKTRLLKQGMMQELLTGKTRLV